MKEIKLPVVLIRRTEIKKVYVHRIKSQSHISTHKIIKLWVPLLTLFLEPIASLRLFWTIFEFFAIKAAALDICRLLSISIKIHMLKTQFLNENTFYLILCAQVLMQTLKNTPLYGQMG